MELVNQRVIYLGKAIEDGESSTPTNPNAYALVKQGKNLVLLHRDFIPDFKIVGKNLVYTHIGSTPPPVFTLKEDGTLVATGAY